MWDSEHLHFCRLYSGILCPTVESYTASSLNKLPSRFTQRRSIANNVECFWRHLFVCGFVGLFVCGCVCQHNNFRTNKHRMIKLGGRCIVQKSPLSLKLGVIAQRQDAQSPKMWRFAKSRRMTQNVKKATRAGGTSHRTQRAHSTGLLVRRWEYQHKNNLVSSCDWAAATPAAPSGYATDTAAEPIIIKQAEIIE